MKLFVAGFPGDFDDTDLKEMFELYGTVLSAKLITDRATGKSKGFGFIEMSNNDEAKAAMAALNGKEVSGRSIMVNEARPQEDRRSNGGGDSRRSGGGNFRRSY